MTLTRSQAARAAHPEAGPLVVTTTPPPPYLCTRCWEDFLFDRIDAETLLKTMLHPLRIFNDSRCPVCTSWDTYDDDCHTEAERHAALLTAREHIALWAVRHGIVTAEEYEEQWRRDDFEWRRQAACAGMGAGLFYIERPTRTTSGPGALQTTTSAAKRICKECPVREECLDFAISTKELFFGIWGGMAPKERIAERKRRRLG